MHTIDGDLSDWAASSPLNPAGATTAGYSLYGDISGGVITFAIQAPAGTSIGASTTIWLDTDKNVSTGYKIFGSNGGYDYNINIYSDGKPYLYTGADAENIVSATPLTYAYNADHSVLEISLPASQVGDPKSLNVLADVNNSVYIPSDYAAGPYTITDVDRAGSLSLAGLTDGNAHEGTPIVATLADADGLPAPGTAVYTFTDSTNNTVLQATTSNSYTPDYIDSGKAIAVSVAYTDAQGHSDTATALAGSVADVDRPGSVLLSGLTAEGETVTATLADPDGVPAAGGVSYAFQLDGTTVETNTTGLHTLGYADSGKVLSVVASYSDTQGHNDVASATAGSVVDVDRPGSMLLSGLTAEGNAVEGQVLTARVTDADGDPATGTVAYDFKLNGATVETNTTGIYTPGYLDAGKSLTVDASYTDGQNHQGTATTTVKDIIDVGTRETVSFDFAFGTSEVSIAHGRSIITDQNGLSHDVTGVYEIKFTDGTIVENDASPLVDDLFYYGSNKDVWRDGMDADTHYAQFGWKEGRNPNAEFSTTGYLAANPDVAAANVNPLTHYDTFGWREGRDPSLNFDNELYLARNPDVKAAGMDPLAHYLNFGQAEGREIYAAVGRAVDLNTHPGFDAEYYLLSNLDVAKAALAAGGDSYAFAYQHYETNGWHEGRDPNAMFDTKGYLNAYQDVAAANMDPLEHYHTFGWKEGRDPSASFDTKAYEATYADVKAAQVDPMLHYVQFGAVEGRSSFADGHFG